MPDIKPTLSQEEQDRLYEELHEATGFRKYNFEKAKQLLLAGVKASNPEFEEKFYRTSVVASIIGMCHTEEQALELLQIVYEKDESPDKSLIRNARSYAPMLLATMKWGPQPFKVADFLIDVAGISVDQRDSTGKTALYCLVERATERDAPYLLPRLQYLLERGASLAITSNRGIPLVAVIKSDTVKELLRNTPQGYLVSEYEQQQAAELRKLYHQIEQKRIAKECELAQRRQIKSHPVAKLLLDLSSLFSRPPNRYKPIPASEEAADRLQKKQL